MATTTKASPEATVLTQLVNTLADHGYTMICPTCKGRGTGCPTCPGGGEIPVRQWATIALAQQEAAR